MDNKSKFNKEELLKIAEGTIFGIDNGKLPLPPMLMVDRVTKITLTGGKYGKGRIVAEMDIDPSLWFFNCHFKDDPVMPGCLGLDALWQMVGFFLTWIGGIGKGRALGCGEVKFKGQIRPYHKKITYRLDFKKIITKPIYIAIADGVLEVKNKTIYFAKNLKVGLFKDLVYPPPEGEKEAF